MDLLHGGLWRHKRPEFVELVFVDGDCHSKGIARCQRKVEEGALGGARVRNVQRKTYWTIGGKVPRRMLMGTRRHVTLTDGLGIEASKDNGSKMDKSRKEMESMESKIGKRSQVRVRPRWQSSNLT